MTENPFAGWGSPSSSAGNPSPWQSFAGTPDGGPNAGGNPYRVTDPPIYDVNPRQNPVAQQGGGYGASVPSSLFPVDPISAFPPDDPPRPAGYSGPPIGWGPAAPTTASAPMSSEWWPGKNETARTGGVDPNPNYAVYGQNAGGNPGNVDELRRAAINPGFLKQIMAGRGWTQPVKSFAGTPDVAPWQTQTGFPGTPDGGPNAGGTPGKGGVDPLTGKPFGGAGGPAPAQYPTSGPGWSIPGPDPNPNYVPSGTPGQLWNHPPMAPAGPGTPQSQALAQLSMNSMLPQGLGGLQQAQALRQLMQMFGGGR